MEQDYKKKKSADSDGDDELDGDRTGRAELTCPSSPVWLSLC